MSIEDKAKRLFQRLSNGKNCQCCKNRPATCSHHIINRGQAETLRYMPINAYPTCHLCHPKIEKDTEWTIKNIPDWQRFMLNTFKNTHIKDYLRMVNKSEEQHIKDMIKEMEDMVNEIRH